MTRRAARGVVYTVGAVVVGVFLSIRWTTAMFWLFVALVASASCAVVTGELLASGAREMPTPDAFARDYFNASAVAHTCPMADRGRSCTHLGTVQVVDRDGRLGSVCVGHYDEGLARGWWKR